MILSLPPYSLNMTASYEDRTIDCQDCEQPFTFSAGEQEWFASKHFPDPIRCKPCRDKRKAQRGKR